MKAAIFDVDGTLVDVSSIRYYVNERDPKFSGKKLWERFHGSALNCPPIPQAVYEYLRAREEGLRILVVTARMNVWALPTLLWLKENGIEHDELYMRRNLDFRKDYVVKRELYEEILADGYEPVRAIDDNPNVIRLWQEVGLETIIIPGWEGQ
jgi:FMN phosphatase YigB (HAD superfamily)